MCGSVPTRLQSKDSIKSNLSHTFTLSYMVSRYKVVFQ
jgi:hypothetical protein